jgi:glycosyltransferase involved in cell wall biosynthesis
MSPLLSVVIASYNHAAFIGEAIRSVLEQSFQDFEILITDDASQDNSPEVIRKIIDPRVSLEVFSKNSGFSIALNASIKRARGKFISVLGSDDFILPGTLKQQIEFMQVHPDVAAVFGMPKMVNEAGLPLNRGYAEFSSPFPDSNPTRKEWLRHFFFKGNCLCHPGVMIRREVHNELGLYDPRMLNLSDLDMWVRLCMAYEIHVMPAEIVARRILDKGRNLSAPRSDTIIRCAYETYHILNHYRMMAPELARQVFAAEIRTWAIDTNRPFGAWLAELALRFGSPAHKLFALEAMFDTCGTAENECARLIELTGSVDVFNISSHVPRSSFSADTNNVPISRNQPCPCNSGLKYKHCHGKFT